MGADVFIIDDINPESSAMLQALYSRSSESARVHIKKVYASGPDEFMKRYYIGFGHESIGDSGVTTIFIEGVSLLAAKAVQDWPLYSGQETSTRYINFANRPMLNSNHMEEERDIQKDWMSFYHNSIMPLINYLMERHPKFHGENQNRWELAINARAFDILRGFLPTGVTTQLSWTTNLRQAHDKLKILRHHPLKEVRELAIQILDVLTSKYPNSFNHRSDPAEEVYLDDHAMEINYQTPRGITLLADEGDPPFRYYTNIETALVNRYQYKIIKNRPRKAKLPRYLSRYGNYQCIFILDFGSFRDLQRHRNGLCQIPLINDRFGFNKWYLEQLPTKLRAEAEELVDDQFARIHSLGRMYGIDKIDLQYLYPLGTNVYVEITYDLPEMVYVTELRSGQSVHPTLRKIAHLMHGALSKEHPDLALYTDLRPDEWNTVRGKQTITEVSND